MKEHLKMLEEEEIIPTWKDSNAQQKITLIMHYVFIYFPVAFLYFIIFGSYGIFMSTYLLCLIFSLYERDDHWYYNESSKKLRQVQGWIVLVVLNFNLLLLVISSIRTISTSPGYVPNNQTWKLDNQNDAKQIERKKKGGIRSCEHCLKIKPDRAHHCRLCDKCILKMDHHCPWVANCVGFFNYKYFLLTVFYGLIGLTITNSMYWESILVWQWHLTWWQIYALITFYSMNILLNLIILAFFIFHIWLLFKNYTTIEFCEKRGQKSKLYLKSPFSISTKFNFEQVLGKNPFLWFIPINTLDDQDGISFEINLDLVSNLQYKDKVIEDAVASLNEENESIMEQA